MKFNIEFKLYFLMVHLVYIVYIDLCLLVKSTPYLIKKKIQGPAEFAQRHPLFHVFTGCKISTDPGTNASGNLVGPVINSV